MTESSYGATTTLIKAARAAAEAFLAALDENGAGYAPSEQTAPSQESAGAPIEYDPLTDPAPFKQDPSGMLPERQMCNLTYLGAIARINASEGRGATTKEISDLAKKAGYRDGRVVNGWNSRPNSHRVIENVDGARYLNSVGHGYLPKLAVDLGISIKGDITPLPIPE